MGVDSRKGERLPFSDAVGYPFVRSEYVVVCMIGLDSYSYIQGVSWKLGISFNTLFAIRIAYGQRLVVMHLGHRLAAWISMVLASSCISLILLSESPFW